MSREPNAASVVVDGTQLHYVVGGSGTGPTIVFIHGGLGDYRELSPLAAALGDCYGTVVYSRRHSFPNRNPAPGGAGHMAREVADLAGLIEALDVHPACVVGVSYGAFIALMLALDQPKLLTAVVAAEPPLLHWLPEINGGQRAHDEFVHGVLTPCRAAFSADDDKQALAIAMEYFAGPGGLEVVPAQLRDMLRVNVEDWRAITTAPDALPAVSREAIASIRLPVLIVSGGRTAAMHRLIDPELLRVLPDAERTVIDDATHEMCVEQPATCAAAIRAFLSRRDGAV